jgi:DNA-directed RNA polymerase III subunit RPC6
MRCDGVGGARIQSGVLPEADAQLSSVLCCFQVINKLLSLHRIDLKQDGNGTLYYKIIAADKVEKLRGLSQSDLLIYQLIEQSSSQGIWIKDLRRKSQLSALEIPKLLKELTRRQLIKCERSIQAANKKVYMLYDIEPAREVSGGSWYDKRTGEFDVEFVAAIELAIMAFLEKRGRARDSERERFNRGQLSAAVSRESGLASLDEIVTYLSETGAFTTMPSSEEVAKILQGLVFEGRVSRTEDEGATWAKEDEEMVAAASKRSGAAAAASADRPLASRKRRREEVCYLYGWNRAGVFTSPFPAIPCATCPVAKHCHEGNPISPQSCEYLTTWLAF